MNDGHVHTAALRSELDAQLTQLGVVRKDCLLLDFPHHANIGDSLIWLGEVETLSRLDVRVVHSSAMNTHSDAAIRQTDPSVPILFHGGGNFGDLWPDHQWYRLRLVDRFPAHHFVQLPQSVWFNDQSGGLIHATRAALGSGRLTLIVRDHSSADRCAKQLGHHPILGPDAALTLSPLAPIGDPSQDVVRLFRRDKETATNSQQGAVDWADAPELSFRQRVRFSAAARAGGFGGASLRLPMRFAYEAQTVLARLRVERGVRLLSMGERLETDRLHAAILGALLGIHVTAYDNTYGKVSSVLDTWGEWISDVVVKRRE